MEFQTDISAQGQTNMVALGNFEAELTSLDASKLLEGAMVVLNEPGAVGIRLTAHRVEVQAVGGPVFRVAVWVNRPKDFDGAIAAQMHNQTSGGNVQVEGVR